MEKRRKGGERESGKVINKKGKKLIRKGINRCEGKSRMKGKIRRMERRESDETEVRGEAERERKGKEREE